MNQLFNSRYLLFLPLVGIANGYTVLDGGGPTRGPSFMNAESAMQMAGVQETPDPTSFREAEILGLRLMQEGSFEDALVGTLNSCSTHERRSFKCCSEWGSGLGG